MTDLQWDWEAFTYPREDEVWVSLRREFDPGSYEYLLTLDQDGLELAYLVFEDIDPETVALPIPLDMAAELFLGLHKLFGNHDPQGTRRAMRKAIQRIETGTY